MNKITLHPSIMSQLPNLDRHLELCDEQGRTVGYFLPPDLHREMLYAWAKTQFTDEELDQARRELKSGGGLTTLEAIDYLQNLASSAG